MTRRIKSHTLDDALYFLVHHGDYSVDELADECGCSASLLYRGASPNDSTGFPIKKLIPVMKKQRDFGPLQHMASRCDFLLVPAPKKRGRMKPEEVAELQRNQADAVHALTKFFDGMATQDETRKAVEQAMGSLARARMAVNHGIQQGELDL